MNDETKKIIKNAYDSLPEELKNSLRKIDWSGRTETIAREHGLSDEQQQAFIVEAMMALFGITDIREMKNSLVNEAGISPEKAEELDTAFFESVLSPVMNTAGWPVQDQEEAEQTTTPKKTMKLHINTTESSRGLIFKKPMWKMDARIELSDEEMKLMKAHPEIGKMTLATGVFGDNTELACSVNSFIKGHKGSVFYNLANQTEFENAIREGCTKLKSHFERLREVKSGPRTEEF